MRARLLEVLACPDCSASLVSTPPLKNGGDLREGKLTCTKCKKEYPIRGGIPRFVPDENYTSSFGLQWNRFRLEQIDSASGTRLSEARFFTETGWEPQWMSGKWILDAGCGAGRFLEVAGRTDAEVIGVDLSSAVDAAAQTLSGRANVHLVQASIYQLPFKPGVFDGVYCIGVIQHMPNPLGAVPPIARVLRAGGAIAVTIYEKRRFTMLNSKYLLRHLTRRLEGETLLRVLKTVMPVVFPVSELAFRLPAPANRLMQAAIPVANYVDEPALTREQRYAWALMDTFDMLAPEYDQPQVQADVEGALLASGITGIQRKPNAGLNLVGRKA
jgi:2-polyprenyl-3-methyl-5-hydroxy-6-metoxy-1,4-benzoquinol methylase